MPVTMTQQFVCTACGFNMIGFYSKRCRFCGATPDHFLSAEDCSTIYRRYFVYLRLRRAN